MLQKILSHQMINVSAIADLTGVSKQALHTFRRHGIGISADKQGEILEVIRVELRTLLDTKVNEQKSTVKSQVKKSKDIDSTESKPGVITPGEWGRLSEKEKKLYIGERNSMGKVVYVLR